MAVGSAAEPKSALELAGPANADAEPVVGSVPKGNVIAAVDAGCCCAAGAPKSDDAAAVDAGCCCAAGAPKSDGAAAVDAGCCPNRPAAGDAEELAAGAACSGDPNRLGADEAAAGAAAGMPVVTALALPNANRSDDEPGALLFADGA